MVDIRRTLPSVGQLAGLLVLIGIGLGLGYLLSSEDDPNQFDFKARESPAEYLYLDAPRVMTYLPQALGGLPSDETQSLTSTRALTLDLKGMAGAAGASEQEERRSERTMVATAPSRLVALLDQLYESGRLRQFDMAQLPAAARTLREGDFVRITNVALRMPDYASDYDLLKTRKDVIVATGPATFAEWRLRAIRDFLRTVGRSPRMSFQLEVPGDATSGDPPTTLLIPAQYSLLAVEPTLLTGHQTLVGKVMRNLRLPDNEPAGFTADRYTDTDTIANFLPALRALPKFIISLRSAAAKQALVETRLRLRLSSDDPTYQARMQEWRESPLRSRRLLERDLLRRTTVTAPGLVVLPLAVYK